MFRLLFTKVIEYCFCTGPVKEGENEVLKKEERVCYNALLYSEGNRFIGNAVL